MIDNLKIYRYTDLTYKLSVSGFEILPTLLTYYNIKILKYYTFIEIQFEAHYQLIYLLTLPNSTNQLKIQHYIYCSLASINYSFFNYQVAMKYSCHRNSGLRQTIKLPGFLIASRHIRHIFNMYYHGLHITISLQLQPI